MNLGEAAADHEQQAIGGAHMIFTITQVTSDTVVNGDALRSAIHVIGMLLLAAPAAAAGVRRRSHTETGAKRTTEQRLPLFNLAADSQAGREYLEGRPCLITRRRRHRAGSNGETLQSTA